MRGKLSPRYLWLVFACLLGFFSALLFSGMAGADGQAGWHRQYYDEGILINAVSAVDEHTCWAVGTIGYATPASLILKTEDGGLTWSQQGPSFPTSLYAVSAVDSDTCWVGGTSLIMKTTDGGDEWTTQAYAEGYQVNSLSAVDANTCWGVGMSTATSDGFIVKTSDGVNWTLQRGDIEYPLRGVSAIDADTCWVAGGEFYGQGLYNIFGYTRGGIWKTTDGGANWSMVGSADRAYGDVSAIDGQRAWAVGWKTIGIGYIYTPYPESCVTGDGGANWTVTGAPLWPGAPAGLQMIDADSAWLAGKGGYSAGGPNVPGFIYRSDDGGSTWVLQDSSINVISGDISAVDPETAWAVGYTTSYDAVPNVSGHILHTGNGGWQPVPSLLSITPDSGIMGDEVTLAGSGFGVRLPTSKVVFGGAEAEIVSWSDEEIVCRVPDNLPVGPVEVAVMNNGGTSGSLPFTVEYATVITGWAWNYWEGYLSGIAVELYGLDGELLSSATTGDDGHYRMVTALPSGGYKFYFHDPGGVFAPEWHQDKDDFASADVIEITGGRSHSVNETMGYHPPEIMSVSPDSATIGGVVQATISGRHFRDGCTVEIGDAPSAKICDVFLVSSEEIACTIDLSDCPTYEAGPRELLVKNVDGQTASVAFNLIPDAPLSISTITPNHGFQGNEMEYLTVYCSGFYGPFEIMLVAEDGTEYETIEYLISETQVDCYIWLVDVPVGVYDVVIENPGGERAALEDAFSVLENPITVTSTTPDYGYIDTYADVVIEGAGFRDGFTATLKFGKESVIEAEHVEVLSPTRMKCIFDLAGAGNYSYDVVVTDPESGCYGNTGQYFTALYTPYEIYSIVPSQASNLSFFQQITVEGNLGPFAAGTTVQLRKGPRIIQAFSPRKTSDNAITCTVPLWGAEPGVYDVQVVCGDYSYGVARLKEGFTVTSPCGQGSGAALLMLGAALGLLTLAAPARRRWCRARS
ncbi:MAG: hypothetical protein HPY75_06835 [Actinobacteria bacterium]|nr:hypothetical protein [Actinomycetota bacterium]